MLRDRPYKRGKRRLPALAALLLAAWMLLGTLPALAAEEEEERELGGAGYAAVLYDNTSGLPTSEANDLVQLSDGFILIGGYAGLVRYDGNSFTRYDATTGLSSVRCLFVDSGDRIWIGTNEGGVAMLSQAEVLRFYDHRDGLNSSSIQDITEDDAGNILIATTMGLAYVDTSDSLHLVDDPQINREYIRRLAVGPGGVVYGLTRGGDLFTVEGLRVTAYYPAEELSLTSTINAVLPDPNKPGFVYLGTQGSDILYGDLGKGLSDCRIFSVSPQKKVNCIELLEDNLWICADNGIGYFDAAYRYTELQGIPLNRSVDQMMADFEGNLWFASSRQGVMKVVKNRFTDISRLASLEPTVVNSTCRYRGELYLGTDNGLILLDKKYRKRETALTNLLARVRIRCIYADRDGYLWLCTYGSTGLVRYDGEANTWTIFNTDNGMASDRIRTCRQLSDGSLAVATTAGLNLISDGQVTATYNNSRGISNLEILCLEETADGRLYLGSDGDGIYVVDGSRVSRIGLEDGLLSEVILRMKQDPVDQTLFWIITSNSIAYMKDEKITTVDGFPYSNNFDLYFDHDGRLWILSSNGVYVVNRSAMLANGEIQYTLYDFSCGLPTVATANSFSQLDTDGTLYVAGSTGVCSVNINDDVTEYGTVRLAVPFLTADDAYYAVPEDGEVRIPSSVKRLTFHPYAFTYSLSNPHIRYQLEGFDDAPTVLTKKELGSVSYTNLDGGTYRFRLSLIDITTGEAQQTLTVTIHKSKALHEQTWFWVLGAALFVLLISGFFFLYYRKKTQKLERRNEENKHLIQDISGAFAKCVDMKDAYTNGHSTRVAHYSALLAARLGKSQEEAERIYNIALLHDIGKISIPDNILNKPGKLTDEEFQVMKSHPSRGFNILNDVSIAPELALGAGYHHEKYDGTGSPSGKKGDEIPQVAQIIAVADTFDAMYSTRPYRKKMTIEAVAAELRRVAGKQLNPDYVELFLQLIQEGEVEKIDKAYTTEPAAKVQEAADETNAGTKAAAEAK